MDEPSFPQRKGPDLRKARRPGQPQLEWLPAKGWASQPSAVFCFWGPFWSLPNEFLTGFSAAAGIALINCFGNLGGFVAPYAIGAISKKTGSLQTGLVFVGISLFASAMLVLALRRGTEPQSADEPAINEPSPAVSTPGS